MEEDQLLKSLLESNPNDTEESQPYDFSKNPNWFKRTFSYMETGSLRGSILTLSANTIGAGLLSLPFAVKMAGLVPGVLMLVLGGWVFSFFYKVLIKAHDHSGVYSYVGLVQNFLGETWRRGVELSFVFGGVGVLCAFQALSGHYLLQLFFKSGILSSDYEWWRVVIMSFASLFVLSPLCIPKQLTSLRYTSSICIFAIFYITVILIIQLPDYTREVTPEVSFFRVNSSMVHAFTLCVFASDGTLAIPFIYQELQRRCYTRMCKVIDRSVVMNLSFYILLAVVGYLSLGENTPSLITDRKYLWEGTDWFMLVAEFLIAFALLFSIPLRIAPLRTGLDQMVYGVHSAKQGWVFYTATYVGLYLSTGIAILVPEAIKYFIFIGGILIVPIAFIIPSLFYLQLEKSYLKRILVMSMSVVLGATGIYSAVTTFFK
mgnify:FL=1